MPRSGKENKSLEFIAWKKLVDNIVFKNFNLHCNDLPDEDYWMNWNSGRTPENMAKIINDNLKNIYDEYKQVFVLNSIVFSN